MNISRRGPQNYRRIDQRGKKVANKASPWNSLEVARLIIGGLTPIMIFSATAYISQKSDQQAIEISRIEKVIDKRREVWDQISSIMANANSILLHSRNSQDDYAEDAKQLDEAATHIERLHIANTAYFTENFNKRMTRFHFDYRRSAYALEKGEEPITRALESYYQAVSAASRDLALDSVKNPDNN